MVIFKCFCAQAANTPSRSKKKYFNATFYFLLENFIHSAHITHISKYIIDDEYPNDALFNKLENFQPLG